MFKNVNELPELSAMIAGGFISRRKHPAAELFIYNYTARAQYENVWNEATLNCRGLIADASGVVVARPFRKFFNWDQLERLPDGRFDVYEKLDGSLGITYWHNDQVSLATRGAFESEQAIRGTQMLRSYPMVRSLLRDVTYLFEIIYPENRIVVQYPHPRLVLLGAIVTENGDDVTPFIKNHPLLKKFDAPRQYPPDLLENLASMNLPNHEGFVLHWPATGERVKVKFEDYKRLHKVLTGITAKRVLEDYLITGQSMDALYERVPDEFAGWLRDTVEGLRRQYLRHDTLALAAFAQAQDDASGWTRKDYAMRFTKSPYSAVLFKMLDGQSYDQLIWKMVKPDTTAFRCDTDA